MHSRLVVVLLALFAALTVGLGAPLALSYSAQQARSVYIDRVADLARFTELVPAGPAAVDQSALLAELRRYEDVYGIAVAVVGTDERVVVTSRPGVPARDAATTAVVRAALAGRSGSPPERLMPWGTDVLVVAQPVIAAGDVVGAVVSVSDLEPVRQRILAVWSTLCATALVVLVAGWAVARGTAQWVLRPVAVLDVAAHRLAGGDLTVRVPIAGGPPELRSLGAAFNDMAVNVEASMTAQRAFVADASHQLRNPLGALLLRLEGLGLSLPDSHRASVDAAVDDGRYLSETLDRMLELARAEHIDAKARQVDIASVVDDRLRSWRVVAENRNIEVRRRGAAVAIGWHDPAALSGAFDAVIDNALKYSPPGTLVTVAVLPDQGDRSRAATTDVVVTDQGPGLADDELGRFTHRFWRGRGHPDTSGSGLGLSIAGALLERHGGTLFASVGPEGGLRVTIRVPAPAEPTG